MNRIINKFILDTTYSSISQQIVQTEKKIVLKIIQMQQSITLFYCNVASQFWTFFKTRTKTSLKNSFKFTIL